MKSSYIKNTNGILMIAIHFGAIFYIFESVSARLEPKDQLALVMILAPLTAAFVSLFLRDLVKSATVGATPEIAYTNAFAAVTILLTLLYGITVFFCTHPTSAVLSDA